MTSKTTPAKNVIVRMYNVGFGDSFLLFFPAPDGRTRKVLIDCGVHMASTNKKALGMKEAVAQIIADATDPDGVPRLDVVIATHRHRDHVHAFEKPEWEEVEVKEVWMPWTEHPTNPKAKEIRDSQSKAASRVKKAAEKKFQMSVTAAERKEAEKAMILASNNLVNKKAMAMLHAGFSSQKTFGKRRYLPERAGGESFESPALPGVTVHAIGPSHDPKVISSMENDSEFYHLMMTHFDSSEMKTQPFRSEWRIPRRQFNANAKYKHLALSENEIKAVSEFNSVDAFGAAAKVEGAVNGTSLMLMFEIGSAFLLFPGDAQWGTWEAAMENEKWAALLEKTTFYKIGHHGSHNATPVKFVEEILHKGIWALACTGPTAAWTDIIPRPKLMKKLREKSKKVVRSDKADVPDPTTRDFKREEDNLYVEVEVRI